MINWSQTRYEDRIVFGLGYVARTSLIAVRNENEELIAVFGRWFYNSCLAAKSRKPCYIKCICNSLNRETFDRLSTYRRFKTCVESLVSLLIFIFCRIKSIKPIIKIFEWTRFLQIPLLNGHLGINGRASWWKWLPSVLNGCISLRGKHNCLRGPFAVTMLQLESKSRWSFPYSNWTAAVITATSF